MVNFVPFFWIYTMPFVFTDVFSWVTPVPAAVLALAFYGVNEIATATEDPFNWVEPFHDISGFGTRIFHEVLAIHSLQRSIKVEGEESSDLRSTPERKAPVKALAITQ